MKNVIIKLHRGLFMAKINKDKKTTKTKKTAAKTTAPKEQKIAKTPAVEEETIAVKPKKKHHVGLILLCVFLTIFIVLPLGFFFIFIFDTSTKSDLNANGELDTSKVMTNIMSDALKDVKTSKKIEMKIGENELDQVLMAAAKKINVEDYIPRMYSTIEDNHYTLYADLQASFIKSRVAIESTIQYNQSEESNDIVFHVDKINLGRCGFLTDLIFTVGSRFINDEKLEGALRNYGLNVDFDLANHEIRYNEEQFRKDMDTILVKALGDNNMFNSIVSYAIVSERLFNVDFNGGITAYFDLKDLHLDDVKTLDLNYDSHMDIITALYNKGVITNNAEAQDVWMFLIKGYKDTKDTSHWSFVENNRSEIESLINTKLEDYKGDDGYQKDAEEIPVISDLTNEIKQQLDEGDVTIDDDILDGFAKSLDIIGNASFIDKKNEDESHTVDYFCMDNFDFKFKSEDEVPDNGGLDITLSLNVNGCPTTFTIPTKFDGYEGSNVAKFSFDKIMVGKITIEEPNVLNNLKTIISDNIASHTQGDTVFSLDSVNNKFILDFTNSLGGKEIDTMEISESTTPNKYGLHFTTKTN